MDALVWPKGVLDLEGKRHISRGEDGSGQEDGEAAADGPDGTVEPDESVRTQDSGLCSRSSTPHHERPDATPPTGSWTPFLESTDVVHLSKAVRVIDLAVDCLAEPNDKRRLHHLSLVKVTGVVRVSTGLAPTDSYRGSISFHGNDTIDGVPIWDFTDENDKTDGPIGKLETRRLAGRRQPACVFASPGYGSPTNSTESRGFFTQRGSPLGLRCRRAVAVHAELDPMTSAASHAIAVASGNLLRTAMFLPTKTASEADMQMEREEMEE
ncbi:hypothetical protein N7539_006457 [Penicillium diatomitis]|uniref:Uncharacterized protein n=1 Tax=Penicillium diatomitis TaxID=2819901 RepID=A0A9X0BT24_9EURO|nr:uncharacterized protein N7539_006457 [Penicillium diatomitis]KAJ5483011.1 hypothetical protein N7539_006457 [Penicillium diatomitis]